MKPCPTLFKPGDVLVAWGAAWEVRGNFLGGLSSESLVTLRCLTENEGAVHGHAMAESTVPARILEAALAGGEARLYTPAATAHDKKPGMVSPETERRAEAKPPCEVSLGRPLDGEHAYRTIPLSPAEMAATLKAMARTPSAPQGPGALYAAANGHTGDDGDEVPPPPPDNPPPPEVPSGY